MRDGKGSLDSTGGCCRNALGLGGGVPGQFARGALEPVEVSGLGCLSGAYLR